MIKIIPTGPFSQNSLVVGLSLESNSENKEFAEGSEVFVVDPASCKYSHDEDAITSYLEKNKLKLKAIVLTHGHFDHVAGLSVLKKYYPDTPVLINKGDAHLIGKKSAEFQSAMLSPMGFDEFLPYVSELPEPDFLIEDNEFLSKYVNVSGMENWKVIHTPGHTEGSCCFYNEKEKLLIAGDTIFYRSWGRTDLPGGNETKIRESLKRVYKNLPEDVIVLSGHDYCGYRLGDNQ